MTGQICGDERVLLRQATMQLKDSHLLIVWWEMENVDHYSTIYKTKKKLHHVGPECQLHDIKESLLCFIFQYRKQGMAISCWWFSSRHCLSCRIFAQKQWKRGTMLFSGFCVQIPRFIGWARMLSNRSRRLWQRGEISWQLYVCFWLVVILIGNSLSTWIKCLFLLMSTRRMLKVLGKKTIHMCTSTKYAKLATNTIQISVDGTLFLLVIPFKGRPNGLIARNVFQM